jgi:hypothetical protein
MVNESYLQEMFLLLQCGIQKKLKFFRIFTKVIVYEDLNHIKKQLQYLYIALTAVTVELVY